MGSSVARVIGLIYMFDEPDANFFGRSEQRTRVWRGHKGRALAITRAAVSFLSVELNLLSCVWALGYLCAHSHKYSHAQASTHTHTHARTVRNTHVTSALTEIEKYKPALWEIKKKIFRPHFMKMFQEQLFNSLC